MHLFIANIQQNQAILSDKESHHMQRVLRLNPGDEVLVSDGNGNIFKGIISNFNSGNAIVFQLEQLENKQQRNYIIELAVAPTKQIDRIEFFLEKAIEVGLDSFYPIISKHSERRKINADRLERIAEAAMKQSLKAEKPTVHSLQDFQDFIEKNQHFPGQKFIAHCHEDILIHEVREVINPNISYQFLIGPEGDFSKDEVLTAIQAGYIPISLGPQRMRTETAALSCVMMAHFLHLTH